MTTPGGENVAMFTVGFDGESLLAAPELIERFAQQLEALGERVGGLSIGADAGEHMFQGLTDKLAEVRQQVQTTFEEIGQRARNGLSGVAAAGGEVAAPADLGLAGKSATLNQALSQSLAELLDSAVDYARNSTHALGAEAAEQLAPAFNNIIKDAFTVIFDEARQTAQQVRDSVASRANNEGVDVSGVMGGRSWESTRRSQFLGAGRGGHQYDPAAEIARAVDVQRQSQSAEAALRAAVVASEATATSTPRPQPPRVDTTPSNQAEMDAKWRAEIEAGQTRQYGNGFVRGNVERNPKDDASTQDNREYLDRQGQPLGPLESLALQQQDNTALQRLAAADEKQANLAEAEAAEREGRMRQYGQRAVIDTGDGQRKVIDSAGRQVSGMAAHTTLAADDEAQTVAGASRWGKAGMAFNRGFNPWSREGESQAQGLASGVGQFLRYQVDYAPIMAAQTALRELMSSTQEYQNALLELDLASHAAGAGQINLNQALETAAQYGIADADAIKAGANALELFSSEIANGKNATDLFNESVKAASQSAINTGQAAAVSGQQLQQSAANFGLGSAGQTRISDVVAAVAPGNQQRQAQVQQAVATSSASAEQAGLSPEQLAAYANVIQQRTGESGSSIASQINRLAERGGNSQFTHALSMVGVQQTGNIGQELQDLAGKYQQLGQAGQESFVRQLGGAREMAGLLPLLQNYGEVQHQITEAENGGGAAADQAARRADNLSGRLAMLTATVRDLLSQVGTSGLFAPFGLALEILQPVIKTIDDMISAFNDIPAGVRSAVIGFGELYAAAKLVSNIRMGSDTLGTRAVGNIQDRVRARRGGGETPAPVLPTPVEAVAAGGAAATRVATATEVEYQAALAKTNELRALRIQLEREDQQQMAALDAAIQAEAVGIDAEVVALTEANTQHVATIANIEREILSLQGLTAAYEVAAAGATALTESEAAQGAAGALSGVEGAAGAAVGAERAVATTGPRGMLNRGLSRVGLGGLQASEAAGASVVAGEGAAGAAGAAGGLLGPVGLALGAVAIPMLASAFQHAKDFGNAQDEATQSLNQLTQAQNSAQLRTAASALGTSRTDLNQSTSGITGSLIGLAGGVSGSKDNVSSARAWAVSQADAIDKENASMASSRNANQQLSVFGAGVLPDITTGLTALQQQGVSATQQSNLLAQALGLVATNANAAAGSVGGRPTTLNTTATRQSIGGAFGQAVQTQVTRYGADVAARNQSPVGVLGGPDGGFLSPKELGALAIKSVKSPDPAKINDAITKALSDAGVGQGQAITPDAEKAVEDALAKQADNLFPKSLPKAMRDQYLKSINAALDSSMQGIDNAAALRSSTPLSQTQATTEMSALLTSQQGQVADPFAIGGLGGVMTDPTQDPNANSQLGQNVAALQHLDDLTIGGPTSGQIQALHEAQNKAITDTISKGQAFITALGNNSTDPAAVASQAQAALTTMASTAGAAGDDSAMLQVLDMMSRSQIKILEGQLKKTQDMAQQALTNAENLAIAANPSLAAMVSSDDPKAAARGAVALARDPGVRTAQDNLKNADNAVGSEQRTVGQATPQAEGSGAGQTDPALQQQIAQQNALRSSQVVAGDDVSAANANLANARNSLRQYTDTTSVDYYNGLKAVNDAQLALSQAVQGQAAAAVMANADQGNPLSLVAGQLTGVADQMKATPKGSTAYLNLQTQQNSLLWQQQQDQASVEEARAAAQAIPGSQISQGQAQVTSAQIALNNYRPYTAAWWQALKQLNDAKYQLSQTELAAANTDAMLGIDMTNPVQVAREKVDEAQRQLQADIARGADQSVINTDTVNVRDATQNAQKTKMQQNLNDAQVAYSLNQVSGAAYLRFLEGQNNNIQAQLAGMKTTDDGYRQLQEEGQNVSQTIKNVASSMSGQFNLGQIKVPTVYDVRESMAAQTGSYNYHDQSVQNIYIDGANTQTVINTLNSLLGPQAVQTRALTARRS